jgi:hypothetical protein
MKKIFIAVIILSISGTLFLSCSKSSATPSTPVVVTGYWLGTYTSATNSGTAGTAFGANGSAIVYNFGTSGLTDTATCQLKYAGTYAVTGSKVDFTVTTPSLATLKYMAMANVPVNPDTLSGTFSSTGGVSGNFSVVKQ